MMSSQGDAETNNIPARVSRYGRSQASMTSAHPIENKDARSNDEPYKRTAADEFYHLEDQTPKAGNEEPIKFQPKERQTQLRILNPPPGSKAARLQYHDSGQWRSDAISLGLTFCGWNAYATSYQSPCARSSHVGTEYGMSYVHPGAILTMRVGVSHEENSTATIK
jgi:hypothetical protein